MRRASLFLQLVGSVLDPTLRLRGAVALALGEDRTSILTAALAPLLLKAVIDQAPAATIELEVLALVAATLAPNVLAGFKRVHM